MMYRQGDVLIVRVDEIPEDAKKVKAQARRYVLAEGEATGHAHAVAASPEVEMFERDGKLWLRTSVVADINHEEHSTISLPPGMFRVVRQREYSPEEIRYVAD